MHLIVDGMNVIGSRPDGWWRDRPAARRQLVDALGRLADARSGGGDVITAVFDGAPSEGEVADGRAAGVEALFAPGGPNAADRVILRLVEERAPRHEVTVVTSDTALAEQVTRAGAAVEGAGAFRARLGH